MAEAVATALETGGTLLAEAGTGTGKTLAYLVPAILSRHRVLVSTGTKNLQEQIFFKDLPALQQALGVPFTATLMKGRSNYLCLQRFDQFEQSFGSFDTFDAFGSFERTERAERLERAERHVLLPMLSAWAAKTDTGDRAELRDLPEDVALWKEVAADAETCLGTECPRHNDCFVTRMRQRAAESDVVIVNHHLLCADASVRQSAYGEVIPGCPTLVVDEAHQLEDVATQYFGYAFSNVRVEDLVRDVGRAFTARHDDEIDRALTRVHERNRVFFSGLSRARAAKTGGSFDSRARYTADSLSEHFEDGMALAGALEGLEAALRATHASPLQRGETDAVHEQETDAVGAGHAPPVDDDEAIAALERRAGALRDDLRFLLRASDPDFVYYLEVRARSLVLRASPVDVSRIIRDSLFDRIHTTVLTSATLAVDGSFEYIKGRLGIREADALRVPSEFDFGAQALLYLPKRMPSPKAPAFAEAAAREIARILACSRGRAFVLFTSYSVLRTVQQIVEMSLPFPVLVQGTLPRTALIERFRSTPNAVLLATSSFWQGVDVVGDALSCVIIDRLPFASPGDPVTAARIDAINARGGDAFAEYQVPLAILALQQGLGRLIRHRSDRGVLAILDRGCGPWGTAAGSWRRCRPRRSPMSSMRSSSSLCKLLIRHIFRSPAPEHLSVEA